MRNKLAWNDPADGHVTSVIVEKVEMDVKEVAELSKDMR